MARGTEIVAGLDLGSSKVAVVIMETDGSERNIIGVSLVPSGGGLREGQVVSIERTTEAIMHAVDEAARMAGCQISNVRVGIGGSGTMGYNSDGTVAIRGGRVQQSDVDRVLEGARAVPLHSDKQILHALPQEFIIDGHDRIRTPVGMNGVRLEARVHVITANRTALINAIECCAKGGLTVDKVVFGGLASSAAVTTREERELGCVVVDVGGGTVDLAVWYDHALVHTVSLDWGGDELTKQIARGLRTPVRAAESIKQRFGCALATMVSDGETMEVPSVGGREPQIRQRHLLCEILEPGLEEMFTRVAQEIDVAGCRELLAAGVVLTGGTANLEAVADLGEDILVGMPVRVGTPRGAGGLVDVVQDARYATAVGLCLDSFDMMSQPVGAAKPTRGGGVWSKMRGLIDQWF
ncbi:MAG: cell division protein FtsA [Deltaproteobacteria bacterium HGW-Deltaproteobacteria-14]|jgi:cell division protein FtsA|nr:MAG: cell division protein FtsA [Deltaproteobacteria bacterium HGW-Deltaproteobacteria-14]